MTITKVPLVCSIKKTFLWDIGSENENSWKAEAYKVRGCNECSV